MAQGVFKMSWETFTTTFTDIFNEKEDKVNKSVINSEEEEKQIKKITITRECKDIREGEFQDNTKEVHVDTNDDLVNIKNEKSLSCTLDELIGFIQNPLKTLDVSNGIQNQESKHEGVRYSCTQCDYQVTKKSNLQRHKQAKHEQIRRYSCDQCKYQASLQVYLRKHVKSKHEGVKYSCDKCEYQVTKKDNLQEHQQSKHAEIRYLCEQREYQATPNYHLRRHKQSKHEGVRYSCNECEYRTTKK